MTGAGVFLLSMNRRLTAYVAATCAAAAIGGVGVALISATAAPFFAITAALFLVLIGVASDLLHYDLPQGGAGSIAFIPYVASALILPRWEALAFVGIAVSIVHIARRRATIKAVFNVAQTVLALSLGIIAFRLLAGVPFAAQTGYTLPRLVSTSGLTAALSVVTFLAVNNLAVSGVLAISGGQRLPEVMKTLFAVTFRFAIFSVPLTIVLGWLTISAGPAWAIALALPILGVRQLYATTIQLQRGNQELLELMVKAIEARDPYTSGHSRRVSQASTVIARAIGLSEREVERVRIAGLLHDVGKIHEDYAAILRKPGKLTNDEWELMKTHPDRGAELIATMSHLGDLVPSIRHHHERWDGKGYPAGIAADAIPLGARIITIADTMDALTSDRPYRAGLSAAEVRAEFIRCRGTQFDPEIIDRVLSSTVWQTLFPSLEAESNPRLRRAL